MAIVRLVYCSQASCSFPRDTFTFIPTDLMTNTAFPLPLVYSNTKCLSYSVKNPTCTSSCLALLLNAKPLSTVSSRLLRSAGVALRSEIEAEQLISSERSERCWIEEREADDAMLMGDCQ